MLLLLALSCTGPADPDPDSDGVDPATGDTGTPTPTSCAVPLRTVSYGDTDRYFVDVVIDGGTEVWQVDTGSGLTFRFEGTGSPVYEPALGTLDAGCGPFPFAGRGLAATHGGPQGSEIAGLVGMDYLLQQPVVLEIEALQMLHRAAPPDWPDAVRVPIDVVDSHALVPVTLEGQEVRLMFDTGAGHTLWVGQEGEPDDEVQLVQDAEGTVFPVYVGTGLAELGTLTRTIPLERAPQFPYFEQAVAALGGNLHGLLGVTTFPGEALFFDEDVGELWIGPLSE